MAESSSISRACLRSGGLSVRDYGGGDGVIPGIGPSHDGVRGGDDGRGRRAATSASDAHHFILNKFHPN